MSPEIKPKTFIQIGEIVIASTKDNIKQCSDQARNLLKDKKVMKYLKIEQKINKLNSYLN